MMSLLLIRGWNSPVPLGDAFLAGVFLLAWRVWGRIAGITAPSRADAPPMLLRRATRAAGMSVLFSVFVVSSASAPFAAVAASALFVSVTVFDLFRFSLAGGFASSRNRIAVVGSSRMAMMVWRALRTRNVFCKPFAGFIDDSDPAQMAPDIADRYLGGVDDLPRLLLEKEIDEVILAVPLSSGVHVLESVLRTAGALGVRVQCVRDIFGARQPVAQDKWEEIFLELLPAPRMRGLRRSLQRAFDLVISALCLAVGWPILIAQRLRDMAGAAGITLCHEVVYGFGRRQFQMLAFPPGLKQERRNGWIACIPQMWNVFRGDMSLVGPRPLSAEEALRMDLTGLSGRFSVRPGITGASACAGGGSTGNDANGSAEAASTGGPSASWVQDWSLGGDLKVLFAAWRAGFRSEDARAS